MTEPTWEQIWARRLERHGLIESYPDIVTAVRAMGSAHAQVMSAAEVSIGIRTDSAKTDIEAALWQSRDLIKTYGLRGTVHLVPADDFGKWTAALDAITRPPNIKDILTEQQTELVLQALANAIDGGAKTTAELDEAVVAGTGPWAADPVVPNFGGSAPRWRHALGIAARRGVICFGPNRGRNSTFQKPPSAEEPAPHEDPLNWLVTTFLHAYGPATPEQFARWTTGSKDVAGRAFADADLEPTANGWINRNDVDWPEPTKDHVRLLPYFDAYTVGCHPRSLLFAGLALNRAAPNGSAGNFPVLLVDGVVAGIWHQKKSGRNLAITVEAFRDLTATHREHVNEEAERIAEIVDGHATVTFDDVVVTSHR